MHLHSAITLLSLLFLSAWPTSALPTDPASTKIHNHYLKISGREIPPENVAMIIPLSGGNVSIKLEPGFATRLNNIIISNGQTCTQQKRTLDFDCLSSASESLMRVVLNDGTAEELHLLRGDPPIPAAADLLRAMEAFVALAANLALELDAVADQNAGIARAIYWLIVFISRGNQLGVQNIIESVEINDICNEGTKKCHVENCKGENGVCTTGLSKNCPCDRQCPPTTSTPSCPNCGGDDGKQKCKGIQDSNKLFQGCPCIGTDHRPDILYDDYDLAFAQQDILTGGAPEAWPGGPECDDTSLPYLLSQLITVFYKDYELKETKTQTLTTADLGSSEGWSERLDESKLNIKWTPVTESTLCADSCQHIFSDILKSSKCLPDIKLPLQLMASEGKYHHDCGTALYSIEEPPVKPPTAPYIAGVCSMKVTEYWNLWSPTTNVVVTDEYYGHDSTYAISVEIFDGARNSIGFTPRTDAGRDGIDQQEKAPPLYTKSKLKAPIIITPLKNGPKGAYIQFDLPGQAWKSNNLGNDPRASCQKGKWVYSSDWKDNFVIFDCTFACGWGGGVPSDGTGLS